MTGVVDTCSFVPTRETLRQWFEAISKSRAYLRVFANGFAYWSNLTREDYLTVLAERPYEEAVSHLADRIADFGEGTVDQFVRQMDGGGVQTSVIHNGDYETHLGVKPLPFEYHAEMARKHPGRFKLLAGVDPLKKDCVDTFRRCIDELGYEGLMVVAFRHGLSPIDDAFTPLYEICQERGLPAWIHSTGNWDPTCPINASSPREIDRVAIRHPALKIMAGHAGWPWVLEMVHVAWRHPNVFLEVSAFRPKSMADPAYGFDSLLKFGAGPLQDKIMFGSTWNMLNMPLGKIFDEVRNLPGVTPALAEKWLTRNAINIFEK
jgi:predicted TIM-barrel fold metal-dependent hydrolase